MRSSGQQGITVMSIMIAVGIAALLAALTIGPLQGVASGGKYGAAKLDLTQNFPAAIAAYVTIRGGRDIDGKNVTSKLIAHGGLSPSTVWGTTWSAQAQGNGLASVIVVNYPVASDESPSAISDFVDGLNKVASDAYLSGAALEGAKRSGHTVQVTYQISN